MAWLLRQGEVLASLEVARSHSVGARRRVRSDDQVGALLLLPGRTAHSLGARCALDVAYLDPELVVMATCRLERNRVGMWRRGTHALLEAEAGAFERWGLRPGDHLEIEA